MPEETFTSESPPYKITIFPAPDDGKHPVILLIHGNFGLGEPYGSQIRAFAERLAAWGYVTAVPQYYKDDKPHLDDFKPAPHAKTLAAAVEMMAARDDVDADRLALIGYSLGAATAMAYIASNPTFQAKVLVDYYGPVRSPALLGGVKWPFLDEVDKFPPTMIFHNKLDGIVPFTDSQELFALLPRTTEHQCTAYVEEWPLLNHAFKPGGHADVESRENATSWLVRHLPPGGS